MTRYKCPTCGYVIGLVDQLVPPPSLQYAHVDPSDDQWCLNATMRATLDPEPEE